MKLIPLPQVPQPAIVHKLKDYFSLPQLIDYANAVAEAKCAELENVLEQNHIKHDSTTRALEAAEAKWSAEKHVRQQTQERLAKALDFIFDYCELSPFDGAGQERYDAITGGMK